jgi:hypothetical protein
MAAFGTTRTFRNVRYTAGFGGKADIAQRSPTDRDPWEHGLEGDQLLPSVPVDPRAPLRLLLTSFGAGGPHFVRATAFVDD